MAGAIDERRPCAAMGRQERATMTLRIGLIGAGRIGRKHAETISRLKTATLAAVADADEAAAAAAAKEALGDGGSGRAGDSEAPGAVFSDHRRVLENPAIDAVVIAAPSNLHAGLIVEAAAAGKQIFCEKPIALTVEEADRAVAAVRKAGVRLQIGFQRRFDPAYERAHAAIQAGELGPLFFLRSTTRDPEPPPEAYLRASPSIFTDTSIHDVDMLRWLAGAEVTEVHAMGAALIRASHAERGITDTAVLSLRFANGALGVIDNCWQAAYGYDVRTEVLGAAGAVEVGHARDSALLRLDRRGVTADYPYWFLDRFGPAYEREIADFARCVLEGAEPRATGDDGRQALAVVLAAAQSERDGRPVTVESTR
jgi:myo-inositol 2-dehydrogenase/D-chiro-inositol 1-dehydrogenase